MQHTNNNNNYNNNDNNNNIINQLPIRVTLVLVLINCFTHNKYTVPVHRHTEPVRVNQHVTVMQTMDKWAFTQVLPSQGDPHKLLSTTCASHRNKCTVSSNTPLNPVIGTYKINICNTCLYYFSFSGKELLEEFKSSVACSSRFCSVKGASCCPHRSARWS